MSEGHRLALAASPDYVRGMYETQRESRKRKLKEGWKRVEAFLDPETATLWEAHIEGYEGPTALVKAGLEALPKPRGAKKRK